MPMPNRNSTGDYRYAYQGQEKDPETGKEAFELRLWDARIGRWTSIDPYRQFHSPYLGMANNPIISTDPDGGFVPQLVAGAFGFVVGAGVELTGQAIANIAAGKDAFHNIDVGDVLISGAEGAIIGATFGASIGVVASVKVGGAALRISTDVTTQDGFQSIGHGKSASKVFGDVLAEGFGAAGGKILGEIPVVKSISQGAEGAEKQMLEDFTSGLYTPTVGGAGGTLGGAVTEKFKELNP